MRAHGREVDLERDAWRPKADGQVVVVAEGLVLREAAAAQRRSGKRLDSAVLAADLDFAHDEQGSVPDRRYRCARVLLFGAAVKATVEQCSARTPLHHLRNRVSVGFVGKHPRSALELEDTLVTAKALAYVHANVEVEADCDVLTPINLAHEP